MPMVNPGHSYVGSASTFPDTDSLLSILKHLYRDSAGAWSSRKNGCDFGGRERQC